MGAERMIQAGVVWADMILCGLWRFGRVALAVMVGVVVGRLVLRIAGRGDGV